MLNKKDKVMTIDGFLYTDIGNRELNEDNLAYKKEGNASLFVVADGLGGHQKGELASQFVVDYLSDNFFKLIEDLSIEDIIQKANDSLCDYQKSEFGDYLAKTTLVLLYIKDSKAHIYHVGDSRLYLIKNKKVDFVTKDHSVVQVLVNIGKIKEKEVRNHPDRNKLLKVIGTSKDKLSGSYTELDLNKESHFLLCTDGLWELVEEKYMIKYLKKSKTLEEWTERMASHAKKKGKNTNMDNMTCIAVGVYE